MKNSCNGWTSTEIPRFDISLDYDKNVIQNVFYFQLSSNICNILLYVMSDSKLLKIL